MQSTSRRSRKRRSLARRPKLGERTAGWSPTTPPLLLLVLVIPGAPLLLHTADFNIMLEQILFLLYVFCIFLFFFLFVFFFVLGVWGNAASVPLRESRRPATLQLQMAGVTTRTRTAQAGRRWKLMVCERSTLLQQCCNRQQVFFRESTR